MTEYNVKSLAFVFVGLIIAAKNIFSGVTQFGQGAAKTGWVPEITWGVLALLLVAGAVVPIWLETGLTTELRLNRLGLLVGFSSWMIAGLVLMVVGYNQPNVWAFTIMGTLGVGVLLYSIYS